MYPFAQHEQYSDFVKVVQEAVLEGAKSTVITSSHVFHTIQSQDIAYNHAFLIDAREKVTPYLDANSNSNVVESARESLQKAQFKFIDASIEVAHSKLEMISRYVQKLVPGLT